MTWNLQRHSPGSVYRQTRKQGRPFTFAVAVHDKWKPVGTDFFNHRVLDHGTHGIPGRGKAISGLAAKERKEHRDYNLPDLCVPCVLLRRLEGFFRNRLAAERTVSVCSVAKSGSNSPKGTSNPIGYSVAEQLHRRRRGNPWRARLPTDRGGSRRCLAQQTRCAPLTPSC